MWCAGAKEKVVSKVVVCSFIFVDYFNENYAKASERVCVCAMVVMVHHA